MRERLRGEMRRNTYDPATGNVTISAERAKAVTRVAAHYKALYGGDPSLRKLREDYAMQEVAVGDPVRLDVLAHFFFWTSWAATTERPDSTVTYTNNWPHEPLVGNRPTGANILWTVISITVLLAGVGAVVWWMAFRGDAEEPVTPPAEDPMSGLTLTPSMRAVAKYVAVVAGLFLVQVGLGILTAHYTVEGQAFYGFPLGQYLPYSLTRTWHIQTGIFWIATAFLAAGLFLAPAVGGREPRFQRLGVNALFGALLLVVVGSLAGEWLSIQQKLSLNAGFWFGHQGYEYVDLGRAWQIALFAGLVLWLGLMLRGLWPALRTKDTARPLVLMFTGASAAIGLLYAAGFFFGARTHLSVMEYWRWWVVHLWVEGFFEVFATAALAFIFAKMQLIRPASAGTAVIASSSLYLFAGIPGTFHHLYFSGTPTPIMAVGASFSALEVVPLVLIGMEAYRTSRLQVAAPWMRRYRWPIRFFVGVAFWNLVGAGLFGFMINPPLALYYMQGLNTTPVHGHAALFGVYGLLALGLVLVVARHLTRERPWRERWLGVVLLGDERRSGAHDRAEPPSGWTGPDLGERGARPLVRAKRGLPAAPLDGHAAVAPDRRRHRVPGGDTRAGLVPPGPLARLELRAPATESDKLVGRFGPAVRGLLTSPLLVERRPIALRLGRRSVFPLRPDSPQRHPGGSPIPCLSGRDPEAHSALAQALTM